MSVTGAGRVPPERAGVVVSVVSDFMLWGFDRRGWSTRTRQQYGGYVRRADAWLRRERGTSLTRASDADVAAWLRTLKASKPTRNAARKALVAYAAYCADTGRRRHHPGRDVPRLSEPRGVPKALDVVSGQRVMAAALDAGPRDAVMVALMLFGALRCTEARTLRWDDVAPSWLRIAGKGGVVRAVPLQPLAAELLTGWREQCPSPSWVLPSPVRDAPLSDSVLRKRLRAIGAAAGVPGLHPHLLRHTAATRAVELGADLRTVQEWLGHASLATTQVYTRVRSDLVAQAVGRLDFVA